MIAFVTAAVVLFVALLPCVASVARGEAPRYLLGMGALALLESALCVYLARGFEDRIYDLAVAAAAPACSSDLVVSVVTSGAICSLWTR